MRVVQLNCVFGCGSTGKIVEAIHRYLQRRGDESYVLYGYGPNSDDSHVFRVVPPIVRKLQSFRSRLTGFPYGGSLWGTYVTIRILKLLQPDVVHIHCYNAYIANIYKILDYLKTNHIPTVITNHAEFMYTGGCTHSLDCNKWLKGCGACKRIGKEHPISYFFDRTHEEWELLRGAYHGFDSLAVCCVSNWLRERAKKSPFFKNSDVVTVLNGLDTDTFCYRESLKLRESLAQDSNKKVVLHVTPDFGSPIKGGNYVIELAGRMRDVLFVIVGNHDGITSDLNNIRFVGRVEDQIKLAEYYSLADACLITSKRETFSMVTAESLCCGAPVVGFKAGGPETIAMLEYSAFVEHGDSSGLANALSAMLDKRWDKLRLSTEAKKIYGAQRMCEQYYRIYMEISNGK